MRITTKSLLIISIITILLVVFYISYYLIKATRVKKIEDIKLVSKSNNYSGVDFHKGRVKDKMKRDYWYLKFILFMLVILYLFYLNFEEKLGSLWK